LLLHDLGLIQKFPRICVAQAENANPLYRSYLSHFEHFEPVTAQKTLASAIQIGNPVSAKRAIRTLQRFDGVVEQASEQELADESARADRTGMFNCPHTGVALAALRKLVERKIVKSSDPRRPARHSTDPSESSGRAAGRCQAGGRHDRPPRRP
jgi:threonine synthase